MVVTNRDDLAERLRKLRSHGMTTLTWDRHRGHASSYDVIAHGFNYRLDELHAAIGRVQLQKLERNNAQRRKLLAHYHQELRTLSGWTLPFSNYHGDTSAHLMVAVAPDAATRVRVAEDLKHERIQTSMHYPLVTSLSAFRDAPQQSESAFTALDQSRSFSQRALTLPLFSTMTMSEVEAVSLVVCGKQELEHTVGGKNASFDAGAR
jgi:dTDP-4-amino-4,6-dideoxygalactose transaminase